MNSFIENTQAVTNLFINFLVEEKRFQLNIKAHLWGHEVTGGGCPATESVSDTACHPLESAFGNGLFC